MKHLLNLFSGIYCSLTGSFGVVKSYDGDGFIFTVSCICVMAGILNLWIWYSRNFIEEKNVD